MTEITFQNLGELEADGVSDDHPFPVVSPPSTLTRTGSTSLTTTVSLCVLSAGFPCREVMVQNDPDNTVDILLGDSGAQTIQLRPGDVVTLSVANVNQLYAKNVTSTTQSINWMALR